MSKLSYHVGDYNFNDFSKIRLFDFFKKEFLTVGLSELWVSKQTEEIFWFLCALHFQNSWMCFLATDATLQYWVELNPNTLSGGTGEGPVPVLGFARDQYYSLLSWCFVCFGAASLGCGNFS